MTATGREDVEAIARSIIAQWTRAGMTTDVHAFVDLFTLDAFSFGSTPELNVGHDQLLKYISAVPKGGVNAVTFSNEHCLRVSEDVIVVAAFVDFDVNFTGTREVRHNRIMFTLKRQDNGQWKIAAQHAAPRG